MSQLPCYKSGGGDEISRHSSSVVHAFLYYTWAFSDLSGNNPKIRPILSLKLTKIQTNKHSIKYMSPEY